MGACDATIIFQLLVTPSRPAGALREYGMMPHWANKEPNYASSRFHMRGNRLKSSAGQKLLPQASGLALDVT
jgi:hypothetical protein